MYEHIAYVQDGPVTLITIDRPERMNAIGPQTHRDLVDAWERFRDDDDAYVAVLTGAGDKAFSAGGDLKSAMDGEPVVAIDPEERAAHARGERPGVLGPSRWTDLYKPTIAAVNGAAYAGGLEWVCWTDLAIADQHATFGVTCRRWNIGLADGGTQRLTRIVGMRARSRPSPSRRSAPTRRPPCAASAARSTRACASRPSASTARSSARRPPRACAASSSATTPTASAAECRVGPEASAAP